MDFSVFLFNLILQSAICNWVTKPIKLRYSRTFVAMLISGLFYIFPKFLPEIRINCFYNQNKVNVLC